MREMHDLGSVLDHVGREGSLDGTVVQGVDLSESEHVVTSVTCRGTTFLGCGLGPGALAHVIATGGIAFPDLDGLPFEPYRPRLYAQGELLHGWDPDTAGSFDERALDSRIHRWSSLTPPGRNPEVLDALARRLHDHAIDDALGEHLDDHPEVVAVMGGHSVLRTDAEYRTVAELGRAMAREGWYVATGGGPGAMEAANLGAWLSPRDDDALDEALALLSVEPDFHRADGYLAAGLDVLRRFDDGADSLAVPTWFYGHEPTNQFATSVAKYFANSIREDGLLAIATRGVVFAPGAAGTLQEVFQDATQNHYEVFGVVSPMVFLDTEFWTRTLPAEPLLRTLAGERAYADLVGCVDGADAAMAFLRYHPPVTRAR
ncbi:LOG family protein [Ilumatobacter sp.]|uniref:LOG family protein n=1 Tax=Ilumatobacter sp. TaxID=1967498 RepID=UPI003B515757